MHAFILALQDFVDLLSLCLHAHDCHATLPSEDPRTAELPSAVPMRSSTALLLVTSTAQTMFE